MSNLVKVISNFIEVKEKGSEYLALCPFHKESTPSFTLVPDKNFTYCFGCGWSGDEIDFVKGFKRISFKEALKEVCAILETEEEKYMIEKKKNSEASTISVVKSEALDINFVKEFIKNTGYKANNYRGIRDEINQFFGHLTTLDPSGKVVSRFYPETNDDGKLTGYKCRNHPKDFSYGKIGATGSKSQLSGQVKFKAVGKYILLVGGEEDKSAAYQMLLDGQKDKSFSAIPVVSPTTGENSVKQIAAQYDFFDKYEVIIIGLDNDRAGIEAAKKVAAVLPKEKVRIATWTGKDPNQMLLDGHEKQFVRDFYGAKEYVSSGISSAVDAVSGIDNFLTAPKITLPIHMHRIEDQLRGGIRSTGAVVNIIADTSTGKSLFADTLIYHWIFNSPIVPTIISLERTKEELAIDLESLHFKKNLLWFKDGEDAVQYRHLPELEALRENLFVNEYGKPRFYIIDERSATAEDLKKQMTRASVIYDSKMFIIDPLTDFLRSLGTEAQEDFMMWEKQQKKEGKVFINVLHTRKPQADKDGNIRFVTEYDALGSGTFVQSADINIVLNRDKLSSCDITRNTTVIDIPKARGGKTGRVEGGLLYDPNTRQQVDFVDWQIEQGLLSPSEVPSESQEPQDEDVIF